MTLTSTSTRTGYMKKLLRMDVNCNPSNIVDKNHYTARLRYTEFFLNYAEAANETWGPTGTGSNSFSAYDIIKKIRQRAGIGLENGDPYLESCKGNKEAMRELIRNERRIELCFEGFRFYDLADGRLISTPRQRASALSTASMTRLTSRPATIRII